MKRLSVIAAICLCLTGCVPAKDLPMNASVNLETIVPDMSQYTFLEDKDHAFLEITAAEAKRLFEEGGSGVLYFGRPNCPFCQRAVPVLNDVAKEERMSVYYVDVNLSKLTMEDYTAIEPYIEPSFVKSTKEDEGGFMIPDVIAVKDGKYVSHHVSLVDGYRITSSDSTMNEAETESLKKIYRELFEAVRDAK